MPTEHISVYPKPPQKLRDLEQAGVYFQKLYKSLIDNDSAKRGGQNEDEMADRPWVFPEDYGAVGNGTHDDTAAIQAAITEAQSNGYPVIFGPYTYIITAPLNFNGTNPGTLIGVDYIHSIIKAVNATPFSAMLLMSAAAHHQCFTIRDLQFNCNSSANYAIYSDWDVTGGASDSLIEHCYLSGALVDAIHLEYGWCLTIDGNMIVGNVNGINISNSANALNIWRNEVFNNTGVGITVSSGGAVQLLGNTIETNKKGGVLLDSLLSFTADGNYFESNGVQTPVVAGEDYGLSIGPNSMCYGGTVQNNLFTGGNTVGLRGIQFGYCYNTKIGHNSFRNIDTAFDASRLPAATALYMTVIDDNQYDTVTTIWNPSTTTIEKYYGHFLNRFRLDGIFGPPSGNLIGQHPVSWERTYVDGASAVSMVPNQYPAFTMVKAVGDSCYIRMFLDCANRNIDLRGKYVTFGVLAKTSVTPPAVLTLLIGDIEFNHDLTTSVAFYACTARIAADATDTYVGIKNMSDTNITTIYDYWLTVGTERPQAQSFGPGTGPNMPSLTIEEAPIDNSAVGIGAYAGGLTIQNYSSAADSYSALRFKHWAGDYLYIKAKHNSEEDADLIFGNYKSSTSSSTDALTVLSNGDIVLTGNLRVGANQVLGAQQTGVAAMTNLTAPANLDANTVTTAELADIVGNLISKLRTHGAVTD